MPTRMTEDTVGAQFASALDVVESFGTAFEYVQQIGKISIEQTQIWQADWEATLTSLANVESPDDLSELVTEHWQRRVIHSSNGLRACFDAFTLEQERLLKTHQAIWSSFGSSM